MRYPPGTQPYGISPKGPEGPKFNSGGGGQSLERKSQRNVQTGLGTRGETAAFLRDLPLGVDEETTRAAVRHGLIVTVDF